MTQRILPALRQAEEAYHQRIPTAALNRVIRDAQAAHSAPPVGRRRPRVLVRDAGGNRSAHVHALRDP